jgi:hypothetical protein
MVPAAPDAWPSLELRGNLEPRLCKPSLRFPGNANFRARDKTAKPPLKPCRPLGETFATPGSPPIAGICRLFRKSPRTWDCVVGLRGLELRAKRAIAIEPVFGEPPTAAISDQMSLNRAANHPERTGVRPQLERYCWSILGAKGCDFRTHNSEIFLS